MSRRNAATKRDVLPDPKFESTVVTKLINQVMLHGKKGVAQNIVYSAFDKLAEKTGLPALEAFEKALENCMPVVETRSRKIGGATYQVPTEVSPARKQTLAIRWLVLFSKKRSEREMADRLGNELIDAFNSTGGAVKKKEDVHRMAEANKAFAHFKW